MRGSVLYGIDAAWAGRVESAESVGAKFFRVLAALQALEPSFRDWISSDELSGHNEYLIEPLRSNIGAWVRAHIARDEDEPPDPRNGYWLVGVSGGVPLPGSSAGPTSRRASFYVRAGSAFRNYSHFEIGSEFHPPDISIVTYPLYEAALLAMISAWPAPSANASCAIWGEAPPTLPGEPAFPYSGHQMPWISYLCAERAATLDVPAGVRTERTPDGGLLMIAAETRFDPANVEHMRPSRLIAQIMMRYAGEPDF